MTISGSKSVKKSQKFLKKAKIYTYTVPNNSYRFLADVLIDGHV